MDSSTRGSSAAGVVPSRDAACSGENDRPSTATVSTRFLAPVLRLSIQRCTTIRSRSGNMRVRQSGTVDHGSQQPFVPESRE